GSSGARVGNLSGHGPAKSGLRSSLSRRKRTQGANGTAPTTYSGDCPTLLLLSRVAILSCHKARTLKRAPKKTRGKVDDRRRDLDRCFGPGGAGRACRSLHHVALRPAKPSSSSPVANKGRSCR